MFQMRAIGIEEEQEEQEEEEEEETLVYNSHFVVHSSRRSTENDSSRSFGAILVRIQRYRSPKNFWWC
jgi:hypothetical protein